MPAGRTRYARRMGTVRRLLTSEPIARLAITTLPVLRASVLALIMGCTTGATTAPPRLVPAAAPGSAAPPAAAPPTLRVVACAPAQQPTNRTFSTYAATADESIESDAGLGSIRTGAVGTFGGPPPTLRLREPVVVGALDAAIVRRYLRRQMLPLVDCFDQRLAAAPTLAGTVALHFTITARGAVADARRPASMRNSTAASRRSSVASSSHDPRRAPST